MRFGVCASLCLCPSTYTGNCWWVPAPSIQLYSSTRGSLSPFLAFPGWSVRQRLTWQILLWPLKPFQLIYRLISRWEVWLSPLERNWTDNKHYWNTGGAGCKVICLGDSCKLSLNESQQVRCLLIHGHYLCSPGQQDREGKWSFCKRNELISLDKLTKLF